MGGKTREKIFPETHVYRELQTMEKNRLEKVRKHVFYKHTNIVTKKWGGKNARKKLSKNTRIGYPKIVEKNRPEKLWKYVSYKHMNIVMKNWGKKTREKFFQKTHE